MATDFRSGRDFPRRARERYGGYDYLLRVFDKGRAAKAGTIFDYIYPCPIDQDVFAQWGISSDAFTAALESCATDEQILAWLQARVPAERRDATNAYVAKTWTEKMDKHDRDESCPSTSLGMTNASLGMTNASLGMTKTSLGMTQSA